MRTTIFIIFLTFLFGGFCSNAQITKSHLQIFATSDADWIELDIPSAQVEVRQTKGSRILVESNITLDVDNVQLVEYLIERGRYNLVLETREDRILLSAPKLTDILVVRAVEVLEQIDYVIFIPKNVSYANSSNILE